MVASGRMRNVELPHGQAGSPSRDFTRSLEHARAAHRLIPGGSHTYAKGDDQYPEAMAPIIERGEGCRVWDIDGNEFVEYGMGVRSVTLGHNYRPVVDAVVRHFDLGLNFARPHRLELDAAERLVQLIPSAEMVKFGINGSDATSAAVRLARAYTGRDLVAVCSDQPFFSTDDWFIGTTPMNAGIPEAVRRLTVSFPYNDLTAVEQLFKAQPGGIAAIVLEAETTEPPQAGYFAGLRRLCDIHGVVLILDEIITGFRWDARGAQHVYGINPDLSTFGKGLANGFPVSALAGRRDLMRLGGFVEDCDRVFLLSQTCGGEPWAMAAVLATIDVYEGEGVTDRLHEIGAALRAAVDSEVARHGLQDYVQLRGRDCNLVFVTNDSAGARSQEFRTVLLQELLRGGVLAPSFVVSFSHDDAAIERTVEAVAAALPVYGRALEDGPATVLEGRPVRPALRRRG
jgi:glutamate-1-semialdehyde 2,1-aminomutase